MLATEFHDYGEVLKKVASKANQVYKDFLKSDEGRSFTGQVLTCTCKMHNITIDFGY